MVELSPDTKRIRLSLGHKSTTLGWLLVPDMAFRVLHTVDYPEHCKVAKPVKAELLDVVGISARPSRWQAHRDLRSQSAEMPAVGRMEWKAGI